MVVLLLAVVAARCPIAIASAIRSSIASNTLMEHL